MAEACLEQRRIVRRTIDPVEKSARFSFQAIGWRRFEMHTLSADGAGHHLHRTADVVTPASNLDPGKAGVAGGKQRGMPAKQSLPGDRCKAIGGRVEYHFNHAFDVTIDRG